MGFVVKNRQYVRYPGESKVKCGPAATLLLLLLGPPLQLSLLLSLLDHQPCLAPCLSAAVPSSRAIAPSSSVQGRRAGRRRAQRELRQNGGEAGDVAAAGLPCSQPHVARCCVSPAGSCWCRLGVIVFPRRRRADGGRGHGEDSRDSGHFTVRACSQCGLCYKMMAAVSSRSVVGGPNRSGVPAGR